MKRDRRKPLAVDPKYDAKVKAMLYGDYSSARKAKHSLIMTSQNLKVSNPEESALLKRVYRRVKL